MLVRAKKITFDKNPRVIGYFDNRRIREGEVFEIPDGPIVKVKKLDSRGMVIMEDGKPVMVELPQLFSQRWMEPVDEKKFVESDGTKVVVGSLSGFKQSDASADLSTNLI